MYDFGIAPDSGTYLVMEYLEGIDLADVLERDGAPGLGSIPRCLHFAVQILRGLQTAHDAGIVHRDMKPSNCFVIEKDGDPDFVKLLDFGISKLQQPGDVKLTQTNSLLGTPLYMSPEQSRSAKLADHRTDLYAVGVIIYELLTGKPPFDSDSTFTELLLKIATEEPIPLREFRPDVPEELAAVIDATPELVLRAQPDTTLLAFGATDPEALDVYAVADALWRRGWYVDRQGPPPSLHCTVNAVHDGKISAFADDLRAAIEETKTTNAAGARGAYGTVD